MGNRTAVLQGGTVVLTIQTEDILGNPVNPTVGPFVDIYPPGVDTTDESNALVVNASLTSTGTGAGVNMVVQLGVGHFSYTYDVSGAATLGAWTDRWDATVSGQPLSAPFNFVVVGAGSIAAGQLFENNLVCLTIDPDAIEADDGTQLESDYVSCFTTIYNPRYCHPRRVNLEIGAFLGNTPEDTINFALFEASLLADQITFRPPDTIEATKRYEFARMQWVCYKAAELLLLNTGGSGLLKRKRLGDLEVEFDNSTSLSDRPLARIQDCLAQWMPQVESGGWANWVSCDPAITVKGRRDIDRPAIGRGWSNTATAYGHIPAANTKVRGRGRRHERTYIPRTRYPHHNW